MMETLILKKNKDKHHRGHLVANRIKAENMLCKIKSENNPELVTSNRECV